MGIAPITAPRSSRKHQQQTYHGRKQHAGKEMPPETEPAVPSQKPDNDASNKEKE
ncbi:hypothetical protein DSM19430T_22690 [Desulfovibrio psychrotolerans]|uniref:Uncharacterized protein n=1 Tax=Desulfovibrio psychrotolerans TaxID=415242 RepID=A0A7J0BWP1_9BACT|nr:hypothetical protein DSM19430T_22690 [Desulfovibrio psychrotolerans]